MSASSIYPYFQVSDINKNVRIKIGSLRGNLWNDETAQYDPQLLHPSAASAPSNSSPLSAAGGADAAASAAPPTASTLPFASLFEQQTHLSRKEVELYVEVAIYSRGSLLALPSHTSYRSFPIDQIKWQEFLVFPIQYKDLAPTSTFIFTIYQIIYTQQPPQPSPAAKGASPSSSSSLQQLASASAFPSSSILSANLPLGDAVAIPLGGASFTMFNKKGLLKLGRRRLNVWRGVDGQDTIGLPPPSLLSPANTSPLATNPSSLSCSSSATTYALEKIIRRYDQREIVCVKWLDRLALKRMEKMHMREILPFPSEVDRLTLTVEFPPFKFPVVYYQKACNPPLLPLPVFDVPPPSFQQLVSTSPSVQPASTASATSATASSTSSSLSPSPPPAFAVPPAATASTSSSSSSSPSTTITGGAAVYLNPNHRGRLFILHDPEIRRENPIELKAHKLARSARAIGRADPHLKPSKSERLAIAQIIVNPSKRLSADAKELLWKYRYSLIEDKRALTKFLRCVNWSDVFETNQALELLEQWVNIEIADALELLSSSFSNEGVRQYGVKQLQRADDEEISNYLLQLVQALRYEPQYPSPLSLFLIARCSQTLQLANFFHWYVRTCFPLSHQLCFLEGWMNLSEVMQWFRAGHEYLHAATRNPRGELAYCPITIADVIVQNNEGNAMDHVEFKSIGINRPDIDINPTANHRMWLRCGPCTVDSDGSASWPGLNQCQAPDFRILQASEIFEEASCNQRQTADEFKENRNTQGTAINFQMRFDGGIDPASLSTAIARLAISPQQQVRARPSAPMPVEKGTCHPDCHSKKAARAASTHVQTLLPCVFDSKEDRESVWKHPEFKDLPAVGPLGLQTVGHVKAFLLLYGCWLADGALDAAMSCITVKQSSLVDRRCLDEVFARLPLKSPVESPDAHDWWCDESACKRPSVDGMESRQYFIRNESWWNYFAEYYGHTCTAGNSIGANLAHEAIDRAVSRLGCRRPRVNGDRLADIRPRTWCNDEYELVDAEDGDSLKWCWYWVRTAYPSWIRLILAGLSQAHRKEAADDGGIIFTSSERFRDEVMQLAIHAGYSVNFDVHAEAGTSGELHGCTARTRVTYQVQYTRHPQICNANLLVSDGDESEHVRRNTQKGAVWCVQVDPAVSPQQIIMVRKVVRRNAQTHCVEKASRPVLVGNCAHVEVERSDARKGQMYEGVQSDFFEVLRGTEKGRQWFQILQDQSTLIRRLMDLREQCRTVKRVEKKTEKMRALLAADGSFKDLRSFPSPIHSPVRPEIVLTGLVGEESSMFRSALAPMNLCFNTQNEKYRLIFKSGDDLRQDQLIIQMFNLMDSLLKKVKLDLNLTPYRVLATSPTDGFVEFVADSYTLTSILDRYDKDIGKFLHAHNPKPNQLNQALQTFVKSCAGYAVITYLLGIGDRHLDNVMMTKSGHLFHIDFSFIFGRDPKPFPPPIKFSKEMVEAMGGASSEKYKDFQKFCAIAFNILRQHASLILNLLWLMGDAAIPDLSGVNGDVEKNLLKVQEKFRLDLSDEEAGSHIISLIDQSVAALFPRVMEQVHKWALYWK